MGPVEVTEENRGHDLGPGNPAPLLRSIPLPVDKVLETSTIATGPQEPLHCPLGVAIHQLRGRGCGGWWHQVTGDEGLHPGDVEHRVDVSEGVREDQPDGSRVDDSVNGVGADEPGCQLP